VSSPCLVSPPHHQSTTAQTLYAEEEFDQPLHDRETLTAALATLLGRPLPSLQQQGASLRQGRTPALPGRGRRNPVYLAPEGTFLFWG